MNVAQRGRAGINRQISTIKTAIKEKAYRDWHVQWDKETKGLTLRKIHPKPSRKIMKLHKGIKRATSSLITQIRTGKIGLLHFLYSRRVPGHDDGTCNQCGLGNQTAEHLLTNCRRYYTQRRAMLEPEERKRGGRMITYKEMLNDPILARKAARIHQVNRAYWAI